jgi:PmbA protein
VSTGETSNDQLTKDKYIEVVDMQGLHSGVNAISGDFSFAFQGFFHENGEKTPVKEMTISGNFFELIKQIESLGDTLEASKGKTFFAPKIRFSGMTCAG